jgi:hypothetical protein
VQRLGVYEMVARPAAELAAATAAVGRPDWVN